MHNIFISDPNSVQLKKNAPSSVTGANSELTDITDEWMDRSNVLHLPLLVKPLSQLEAANVYKLNHYWGSYNTYFHQSNTILFLIEGDRTARQTEWRTARQTDWMTDGQTDRQSDGQTDRMKDGQTDEMTDGQTDWMTDDQTDRMTDGQIDWMTNGRTDRQNYGQTDRMTDRQTEQSVAHCYDELLHWLKGQICQSKRNRKSFTTFNKDVLQPKFLFYGHTNQFGFI